MIHERSTANSLGGMKRSQWFRTYVLLVRLGLGCLFLWSSIPKIRQPYDFLGNIYEYELFNIGLGMLIAMGLPWLGLFVGLCLISGLFVSGALLASTVLLGIFAFAQASVLGRGLPIGCGCFSGCGEDFVSYGSLLRVVLVFVAASLGFVVVLLQSSTAAESVASVRPTGGTCSTSSP